MSVRFEILRDIQEGGEARVRHYAKTLDGWTGDIIVSHEEIDEATAKVPEQTKQDIRFSSERVKAFPCFRMPWA